MWLNKYEICWCHLLFIIIMVLFVCKHCFKVCQSKRGLNYHHNSYHGSSSNKKRKRKVPVQKYGMNELPPRDIAYERHDDGTQNPSHLRKKQSSREENLPTPLLGNELLFNEFNMSPNNQECSANLDMEPFNPHFRPTNISDPPHRSHIGMPKASMFQIDLLDLLQRRRVDLGLNDEIVSLIKYYSHGKTISFMTENLKSRHQFLNQLEDSFGSRSMKPKDIDVELSGEKIVSVSVFDIEAI